MIWRRSSRDAILVALAAAHGAILAAMPPAPLVALGLWWNANTVSHHFIHGPFFRSRALNGAFSLLLSALLGFPQTLWRARHLAHHAGAPCRGVLDRATAVETLLVLALWGALAALAPVFFLTAYLPGWAAGLALCALQGRYEHARGAVSHYGRVYNFLFFNDGHHAEHHAEPGRHWASLRACRAPAAASSAWPPVLRWLEALTLDRLERVVLRFPALQRLLVACHERAFRRILRSVPDVRRVGVVGGGLFPRTALVLRRLLPGARITVIDKEADHLRTAQSIVGGGVEFVNAFFDPARPGVFDLLVIPLAFVGDRSAIYRCPPARAVAVHDWIWRRRGSSAVVSSLLLKRINLVRA